MLSALVSQEQTGCDPDWAGTWRAKQVGPKNKKGRNRVLEIRHCCQARGDRNVHVRRSKPVKNFHKVLCELKLMVIAGK